MAFGARMLKTGIAITISLYISILLNISSPVIAAVAAIFAMQPTLYRSWRHILEQLQTNTVGAVLALVAGMFFSKDPIAIGIVCILVIMICLKLKMEETVGLTLVTVIAVMEASGQWDFALKRFVLILIGIGTASLINILFFPPKPKAMFVTQIHSVFDKLSLLLRTVISNEMKESIFRDEKKSLENELSGLAGKYKLLEEEIKNVKGNKFSQISDLVIHQQMLAALRKGLDVLEAVDEHYFSSDRTPEDDARFDRHLEALIKFHEHVLLKFDKKLKDSGGAEADFMEAESNRFQLKMLEEHHSGSDSNLRLTIVIAALYDYSYQIRRLDKLVEHDHRGTEEKSK